ncbi:hypothetical protein HN873_021564, partial [Arachis hypogaea]
MTSIIIFQKAPVFGNGIGIEIVSTSLSNPLTMICRKVTHQPINPHNLYQVTVPYKSCSSRRLFNGAAGRDAGHRERPQGAVTHKTCSSRLPLAWAISSPTIGRNPHLLVNVQITETSKNITSIRIIIIQSSFERLYDSGCQLNIVS